MSTVVQPRREAASYVSAHAGAVGELVVDTTNQRVTVHDGSTLGGFPAAGIRDLAGFNLGINTNGAINQRGVSGTVTLAAGVYGHDRMKAGANGCTYTFSTAASGDTTFTISAGSLIQPVDVGNVFSTAMWLTWTGTVSARVYQGAASGAPALAAGVSASIDGTTVATILQSGLALGTITYVEFGTGTLNTTRPWQLEAALSNAGPSRLGRRHGEMALCQRYYAVNDGPLFGNANTSSVALFIFPMKVTMRAIPTLALLTTTPYIESPPQVSGYTGSGSSLQNTYYGVGSTLVLIGGFSGLTPNYPAILPVKTVSLSAEL